MRCFFSLSLVVLFRLTDLNFKTKQTNSIMRQTIEATVAHTTITIVSLSSLLVLFAVESKTRIT